MPWPPVRPCWSPTWTGPGSERRWPAFLPAASAVGVRASFALPLVVGEVRLGAMDLYRTETGRLDRRDLAEAEACAGAAVELLLALAHTGPPDRLPDFMQSGWVGSSVVHQASGMVMVQLSCDIGAAFAANAGPGLPRGTPAGRAGPGRHRAAGPVRPVPLVTAGRAPRP
jgi:hypothetical protein